MRQTMRACGWLLMVAAAAAAQRTGGTTAQDFPRFSLRAGAADSDGLPTAGAQLCTLPPAPVCFTMPASLAEEAKPSGVKYEFGLEPRTEREALPGGGSWVFFASTFSGGGSGTLTRLAMLRFDPAAHTITNLLPKIGMTNISDWAVWRDPAAPFFPVLVTADFLWDFDAGETHFDPHRFSVDAWRFDPAAGQYRRLFTYKTTRKYDSEVLRVLVGERSAILQRLAHP